MALSSVMYCDRSEHNPPHFHAYYQRHSAMVAIDSCEIVVGSLPPKQSKLVTAWAELHRDELMADWELATNGELPFKIEPLK